MKKRFWIIDLLKEEEQHILNNYTVGSKEALDEYLKIYTPQLKKKVPLYYKILHHSPLREEIIQEAFVVLCHTYKNFDPKKASYAVFANLQLRSYLGIFCRKNLAVISYPGQLSRFPFSKSLNVPLNPQDRGSETALDLLQSCNPKIDPLLHQYVQKRLNEREQKIFSMMYEGYSMSEIGKVFDVSRERIRQIKNYAIHKIKDGLSVNA